MRRFTRTALSPAVALWALAASAEAHELYRDDHASLSADLNAGLGVFSARRNYIGRPGSMTWEEGFAKYGIRGQREQSFGTLYGSLAAMSTATWGDGDPGGLSTGRERRTAFEEAYAGWKSGNLVPALGQDGIDFSAGRQIVKAGSGFIVNDDGVNPGKAVDDGRYDRGGSYYFGQRRAFARTAVLRLGDHDGLHGSAMWLQSETHLQANTAVAVGTLEYAGPAGNVGLLYLRGLKIDERYVVTPTRLERQGMAVYSLFAEGSAGIPNADFAVEYAHQSKRSGAQTAGYADAGYTFVDLPGSPMVSYRYTRYSRDWDFLFQGGFRMRYQGEVGSNYAFSYIWNTRIHDVSLTVKPTASLTVTAQLFDYRMLDDTTTPNVDAREFTVYADWAIDGHFTLSPIVGIYKPRQWEGNGGNQSGSAGPNVYGKLMLTATF